MLAQSFNMPATALCCSAVTTRASLDVLKPWLTEKINCEFCSTPKTIGILQKAVDIDPI